VPALAVAQPENHIFRQKLYKGNKTIGKMLFFIDLLIIFVDICLVKWKKNRIWKLSEKSNGAIAWRLPNCLILTTIRYVFFPTDI